MDTAPPALIASTAPKMKKKRRVKRSESKLARKKREMEGSSETALLMSLEDKLEMDRLAMEEAKNARMRGQNVDAALKEEEVLANMQLPNEEPDVEAETPETVIRNIDPEAIENDTDQDDEDDVVIMPILPKNHNPYEDMPKKMDDILGPIRTQKMASAEPPALINDGKSKTTVPSQEILELDPEEVNVYYETGDYSVAGLNEDIKLKQVELSGKEKIEKKAKLKAEERKKSIEMYSLQGKPAKFPKKSKKKPKEVVAEQGPEMVPVEQDQIRIREEENLIQFEESIKQLHEAAPLPEEDKTSGIPGEIQMISKEEQVEAWLKTASPPLENNEPSQNVIDNAQEEKRAEIEEQPDSVTFHKPQDGKQSSVRPKKPISKQKRPGREGDRNLQFLDPHNLDALASVERCVVRACT